MARSRRSRSSPSGRLVSRSGKRRSSGGSRVCPRRVPARSAGNSERILQQRRAPRPTVFSSWSSGAVVASYVVGCDDSRDDETAALMEEARPAPRRQGRLALALFCALLCTQCCVWNTWGPIAGSALAAFPAWNESQLALLSDWGCIGYLTCCVPCCWLLHKKGLPMPIRMAAILSTLATFVRCVSSEENVFTITAHIAAILNGLSGVILGPATALVSAVWFPPGERTTATGISSACNQLGMAISYLIGPAIVGSATALNFTASTRKSSSNESAIFDEAHFVSIRVQIMSLMRIEFVGQFLVLIGVLCFFPKKSSQSVVFIDTPERLSLAESILRLVKNKNMWRLCLAAALSQGVTGPWLAMMTMTFGASITQEEADRLAFWTVLFSSALSLIASRLADVFQSRLKLALYVLLATSSAMFLWVLLLDDRVLAFHKGELYVAVILGISASSSTPALFLELASEIAFPISEAIVGGYMIFLSNLIGALFYFSYFLPWMSEHWSTYCAFGTVTMATILVIYVKEDYIRTKIESKVSWASQEDIKGCKRFRRKK